MKVLHFRHDYFFYQLKLKLYLWLLILLGLKITRSVSAIWWTISLQEIANNLATSQQVLLQEPTVSIIRRKGAEISCNSYIYCWNWRHWCNCLWYKKQQRRFWFWLTLRVLQEHQTMSSLKMMKAKLLIMTRIGMNAVYFPYNIVLDCELALNPIQNSFISIGMIFKSMHTRTHRF